MIEKCLIGRRYTFSDISFSFTVGYLLKTKSVVLVLLILTSKISHFVPHWANEYAKEKEKEKNTKFFIK